MEHEPIRPPYQYFGGKRRVAGIIWEALGSPGNYVEPFFGSGSILLARTDWENKIETVNELNPYIANFFRAIQKAPDEVAAWADNPVFEVDLHARHLWLIGQGDFKEKMLTDPDYYEPKIAGWWVWGVSAWIGGGWCEQAIDENKRPRRPLPHVADSGRGTVAIARNGNPTRQVPVFGRGINGSTARANLEGYFETLANRLKNVRVTCGDWSRIVGPAVTEITAINAVVLDPPYEKGNDVYAVKNHVAGSVLDWCKENWEKPNLRIVLCGYEGEFEVPAGWRCVAWKGSNGFKKENHADRDRERIWFSPACLPTTAEGFKRGAVQPGFNFEDLSA